jgi:hypothetical protein
LVSNGSSQTFPVQQGPTGIAYDGTNIWVVNQNSNSVSKLNAASGAIQGTFRAVGKPYGIVFDGTYTWVSGSGTLTKLDSTGIVATYSSGGAYGTAFDGASVWVANSKLGTVSRF